MKNIAVMLRKEGKTSTKLYKDLRRHDNLRARLNLLKLEVDQLTPKQKRQLKSMKFTFDTQVAVDAALSNTKAAKQRSYAGGSAERYLN